MPETQLNLQVAGENDALTAFILNVHSVTNEINGAVAQARGEAPGTPPPTDIESPFLMFARYQNQPTREMLATAASHVLMHHVLPAEEGPLAAMGERARKYQDLFADLGQEGLAKHLYVQVGWLASNLAIEKIYGPDHGAEMEAERLDMYRLEAPSRIVLFDDVLSLLGKRRRQVRRALADIVFGGLSRNSDN